MRRSIAEFVNRVGYSIVAERYWKRVHQTAGCWPWTGYIAPDGYGIYSAGIDGKTQSWQAHRLGYYLVTEEEPGEAVRHRCDNRLCNRPSHLVNGTLTDNNRDRSDLTLNLAIELRETLAPTALFQGQIYQLKPKKGELIRLAKQLDTTVGALEGILSGRRWRED